MNRRSFLKRMLSSLLGIIGISGGAYYYARDVEPAMLHIHKEFIASNTIPSTFNNFKIAQFSDTHVGFHYTLDQLSGLVNKVNKQKPDLIVFTGDLIDEPQSYRANQQLIHVLRNLDAKYGKFWIYGNHDHGGYGTDIVRNIMEEADFQLLKNSHIFIEREQDKIILAGVDDAILGKPDLNETLKNADPNLFTLLLAHEPDYADITMNFPVNIQLSGHSHGGQVRLPYIGHLYTPRYAEKYVQGKYAFNNGDFTLYVSKGVGTTRLPFRFLCKPEINIFTLISNQEKS